MTHVSRNASREASLELSLNAHKSLVADYAQRAKQAEAAAAMLMRQKMDADGIAMFAQLVAQHMEERGKTLAVHQQALLQTTLVALDSTADADEASLREVVNNVRKAITTAIAQMNYASQGRASRPNHPTQE